MLILTAADLYTGELRASLALEPRPRAPAAPAAAPAAKDSFSDDPTAMLGEGHTFDLAALLRLPAARREYLVTAILLDKVSNRSRMKVVESGGYQDPAVDGFLRERLAGRLPLPEVMPAEAEPLPSYRPADESPPIPESPGLVLSIPRVSALAPDEPCIVRGSFRLPVLSHQKVKPPEPEKGRPPPPPPEDKARIPISLLLTGSVDHAPKVLKLVAPCYEPLVESEGKAFATGHFAFDLYKAPDLSISPQTYFIYGFAGEAMAGPVPAAFVRLPAEEAEPAAVSAW
jgi:hypothetical protein